MSHFGEWWKVYTDNVKDFCWHKQETKAGYSEAIVWALSIIYWENDLEKITKVLEEENKRLNLEKD